MEIKGKCPNRASYEYMCDRQKLNELSSLFVDRLAPSIEEIAKKDGSKKKDGSALNKDISVLAEGLLTGIDMLMMTMKGIGHKVNCSKTLEEHTDDADNYKETKLDVITKTHKACIVCKMESRRLKVKCFSYDDQTGTKILALPLCGKGDCFLAVTYDLHEFASDEFYIDELDIKE